MTYFTKYIPITDFSWLEKIIIFCLSISLFGHVHYYFYPYVSDVGSAAPNYINYIFLGISVVPLMLCGFYNFLMTKNDRFSVGAKLYFLFSLFCIFASYPSTHYLNKEFVKLLLFLILLASAFGLQRKISLRSFHFFIEHLFCWLVAGQCLFNIVLWLRRHELWLGRQVGFLGNPSMMGLVTVISLVIVILKRPYQKWSWVNVSLTLVFSFSLFITGAKFCTLLYFVFLVTSLFLYKAIRKRALFALAIYIPIAILAIYSPIKLLFPPVLVTAQSNSFVTRVQQFERLPAPKKTEDGVFHQTPPSQVDLSLDVAPQRNSTPEADEPKQSPDALEFGSTDNQFLDISRTLGIVPMILILFPFLGIFIFRFSLLFNLKTLTVIDITFTTILISFLVYRSIFYFPISLFLVFSAVFLLTAPKSNISS